MCRVELGVGWDGKAGGVLALLGITLALQNPKAGALLLPALVPELLLWVQKESRCELIQSSQPQQTQ